MSGRADPDEGNGVAETAFSTLLYRYVFFDWLFADFGKARSLFERHAAWQHNRAMRRYLPVYLRRWTAVTAIAFALGWLFEQTVDATVAACFFTGCAMTMTGMAQICALWLLLGRADMPSSGGNASSGEKILARSTRRFRPPDDRGDRLLLQS